MDTAIRPLDVSALRQQYLAARPFPFFKVDNFLDPGFAAEVVGAYPSYEQARALGQEFSAVNERLKIQVTDSTRFPPAVKQLSDALASHSFLAALEQITGIPSLLADEQLVGGGMHLTGPGGRLDVHVDFNYEEQRRLHRRLNILIYLNPEWRDEWGGAIELWDEDVKHCAHSFKPVLNRCVVFETSEISYHGVSPNVCPIGEVRRSFAAYYYTKEAPDSWAGVSHGTLFKARPSEAIRGAILMPAEKAGKSVQGGIDRTKKFVKRIFAGK